MTTTHTYDRLAEYLRLNPEATMAEALGATDADPEQWGEAVADALEADEPHTALAMPADRDETASEELAEEVDPEATETDAEEPGSTAARPGVNTGETTILRGDWRGVEFPEYASGDYPRPHHDREQWMGRLEGTKTAFAPWGDADHPEADPEKDARYKWGLEANYATGEEVAMADDDPRLNGRIFIQRDGDPFGFVDGDDVRCPETGEVHPAFIAILEHLGLTYADVSTSGAGVHAYYKGELPLDGHGQATFEIDTEPWGENDTAPSVEIYANKHLCITTGDRVAGTPTEAAEWDSDALRAILEANGYDDKEPVSYDTDADPLADYEPATTGIEEVADDVRDVYAAVERLTPRDLPLRTSQTGEDATGWQTFNPSYRASESGESLHYNGEGAFHDHKEGESFGVLSLFAAEEGIITNPWDRLAGQAFFEAIDAAREAGAPIPEPPATASRDGEPEAVLPPAIRDLTGATSGWDWRHTAGQDADAVTIEAARERTTEAIADAYGSGDRVLIEALPTMGKSYGAILAAAETGDPITVVTGRGRKEQYEQYRQWCDEHGLSHYTLPSFTHDCETANGTHGQQWADRVRDLYNRGATPKEIHKRAEDELGRPLPCQAHEGQQCSYTQKWDFEPDDYDVLIGHYSHTHKDKVTTGRTVVFDEFPDAFETTLGHRLQPAVSYWLAATEEVPFGDYTDLIEHRDEPDRRADALIYFEEHGIDPTERHVFADSGAHALAPMAVFALLAGDDLGNGFEAADLGDHGIAAYDRSRGEVSILQPPAMDYASGIVALDGTPTKRMWELALGGRLNHRPVLQPEERAEYITDALNLNIVSTTEYVKPYNSADHVNTERDAALLEAIADEHGERPSVITTVTAEDEYADAGVSEYIDRTKHYGNVLGSNEFKTDRLGAVIGSQHYGDGYLKKWGAYAGEAVKRDEGKGVDLSYTGLGDQILTHMREHETLQAAMRFGRDGNGAVVYVHTDTLPEWVPVAGEGRVIDVWSDGMQSVVTALERLGEASTSEIADALEVDLSRQQVFEHLETLRDRGMLVRQQDAEDGRRLVWSDDGLHRLGEHGDAELEPVSIDDLTEAEVRQVSRSSIYTWEFTNTGDTQGTDVRAPASSGMNTSPTSLAAEERPPDPAD